MSVYLIVLGFLLIGAGIYIRKAFFAWIGLLFASFHSLSTANIIILAVIFLMVLYLYLIDYQIDSHIDMIAVDLDSDKKGAFCDNMFKLFSNPCVPFRFWLIEGIFVIYIVSFIFVSILKFVNKSIDFKSKLDSVLEFLLIGKGANIVLSLICLVVLTINLILS